MDEDVRTLYNYAMSQLMEKEAAAHKCFFTNEEFEKNIGDIFIISDARMKLLKKLELKVERAVL